MQRQVSIPLTLALLLALGACSREEEKAAADAGQEAAVTDPRLPAAAQPVVARSPYEKAVQSLRDQLGHSIEIELAHADGTVQYLAGGRNQRSYAFSVRTLPQPDDHHDGSWTFQAGRYFRMVDGQFTSVVGSVSGLDRFIEALAALPREERALLPADGPLDSAGGAACRERKVDLGSLPGSAGRFLELGACIDEDGERVMRISATNLGGERLQAVIGDHGTAISLPETGAKEWWEEMQPR